MNLLNKVKIIFFICFITICFFNTKSFATTGTITDVTVNVREKASTESKKIMYVTQDDKVEILAKDGEWYKIKYNNKTGYVFGKYIKVDDDQLVSDESEEETEGINDTNNNESSIETEETNNDVVSSKTVKIDKDTQIRILPNILSNSIYVSNKEMEVTVIEQLNNWTYISSCVITGWIRTDKIITEKLEENDYKNDEEDKSEVDNNEEDKEQEEISTTKKILYIKYDTVNLRKSASATSTVLAKLKLNDEVTVLEKTNTVWTKVEVDGKTGYISTELLSDEKQKEETEETKDNTTSRSAETTSREDKNEEKITTKTSNNDKEKTESTKENSVTGEDIVSYAKQFIGYKYVYGAASPSTGFDCSGFTYYVYKHFGYELSRASTSQAKNGVKVEKNDIQPGDILVFKNQALTKIGHVGIYIGNNRMIHASEPGVGVVITDLDANGYNYSKRFVMARRIIK